ncbi:hypothetical protein ACCS92_10790 [Rhizobium ruizarguesonis]
MSEAETQKTGETPPSRLGTLWSALKFGALLTLAAAILCISFSPHFCRDCFYINNISQTKDFSSNGYENEFIKKEMAGAYDDIRTDVGDRVFHFFEDGRVLSLLGMREILDHSGPHPAEIGDVTLDDPAAFDHGVLRYSPIVDYKLPGLDIGVADLMKVIEFITGWHANSVNLYFACGNPCTIETLSARADVTYPFQATVTATGDEMLDFFKSRSQGSFLSRAELNLAEAPASVDFLRFVT